jgi:hypothetical protein
MRAQLHQRAGIFSCDEFAVVSDSQVSLGQGPQGPVDTLLIDSTAAGVSKDHTAANTLVFIHAWKQVERDSRFRYHDWIIKADPDAVILPGRLRQHLSQLQLDSPSGVYLRTCARYRPEPELFGAVEAFSRQAMLTYFAGADHCEHELQWQAWGEDVFMSACMDKLGVQARSDLSLVGDNVCTGANCHDSSKAAFHPFKSPETWLRCLADAST